MKRESVRKRAIESGKKPTTVYKRMRRGMSMEEALREPVREHEPYGRWK